MVHSFIYIAGTADGVLYSKGVHISGVRGFFTVNYSGQL